MQAQHRLTQAETEQIAAEYRTGGTLPQIAKRWCINRETARLALTRAGEPVRERGALTPSMLEEALRLRAEGWSLNRLGAKFGIDPKTMKKLLTADRQETLASENTQVRRLGMSP
jgi:DNA-binding CsgD family transcriptional regulator